MSVLKLWKNFDKKNRSTARPMTNPDYTPNIYLKDDTTYDHPTFLLDSIDEAVNMIQWDGRYYSKVDIKKGITGQFELECKTDYGATFKEDIGNYVAFVERAASSYDLQINDDAVSQKQTYQIDTDESGVIGDLSTTMALLTGGCYVIRVVGDQSLSSTALENTTGITSYIISSFQLGKVLDFLFNDGNYADVFTDGSVKAFFNPFQYIVDLQWVPINYFSDFVSNLDTNPISLGWWDTDVNGHVLKDTYLNWSDSVALITPRYGDFRDRNSKWTRIKAYFPLVGNIELDPVDYYKGLTYDYTFDVTLGDGIFTLYYTDPNKTTKIIYQTNVKFGVKMQIGQIATDVKGAASSIASGTAAAASGNVLTAATSFTNSIFNMIQPTPSLAGQPESRVRYYRSRVISIQRLTADSGEFATQVYGRPLCKNVQISTLSGFVKCAGADVPIHGSTQDREAVNELLNGGFYYE